MSYEEKTFSNVSEKELATEARLEDPQILSHTSLLYHFPEYEGRELRPGEKILFIIPDKFRKRIVRDVTLLHRKAEKYTKNIGVDGYDPHGAYSEVKIQDMKTGKWLGWRDPSGYNSVKFAEPRPSGDPENEVLHDWLATVGKINPRSVEVANVGKDPEYSVSQIHGLEITFFPENESMDFQERIYCPGTSFIDPDKEVLLPEYGGGEHTGGIYNNAIALNRRSGDPSFPLGEPSQGVENGGSQLAIRLEPGRELVQIEVAVGDTEYRPDKVRLGWAKLWIGIRHKDSNAVEWFVKNANVPPQGVISGGPFVDKSKIEDGDELIVESRFDTAYVMGYRLAYKKRA